MKRKDAILDKVKDAIVRLKKGREKLTIKKIAEKAKIARKTIYNRPELKQLCNQAIHIQQITQKGRVEIKKPVLRVSTSYQLLEERYNNLKKQIYKQVLENKKLLYNNKELVLEKEQHKSKIVMLEERIERLNRDKLRPIK